MIFFPLTFLTELAAQALMTTELFHFWCRDYSDLFSSANARKLAFHVTLMIYCVMFIKSKI